MYTSPPELGILHKDEESHVHGADLERYIHWGYNCETPKFEIKVTKPGRFVFNIPDQDGLLPGEADIVDACIARGSCFYHELALFLRELCDFSVFNCGKIVVHFGSMQNRTSHFMLLYK